MRLPPAPATTAIVAGTVATYVVLAATGLAADAVPVGGFIPARVAVDIALPGALPVWLTPLSATVLHAGVLHLAFNMLMLGFCGRLIEAVIGPVGMLLLYVVGAYAAAAAQYLATPLGMSPMIGASGAASAVLGAYALLFGTRRAAGWGPRSSRALTVAWLAAGWIGLQLLVGMASGGLPGVGRDMSIAVAAHIGGFIAGLVLAQPLLRLRRDGA